MTAGHLRTEYRVNPLGIDERLPRLSWIDISPLQAQRQTAYEIMVATTAQRLQDDQPDLWNTGKIASDETVNLAYAGQRLTSRQRCYWKVRVWDQDGSAGPWSEAAWWEMGLLQPSDWSARWIECGPIARSPADKPAINIVTARYESLSGSKFKDVSDVIRQQLAASDGFAVLSASSDSFGGDPAAGEKKHLHLIYRFQGQTVDVTVPEHQTFTVPPYPLKPMPYVRTTFVVNQPVRSARLYATALGLYELHLNGARVGDHVLAPDWTDYGKRVQYQTYDVTPMLQPGENAMGAIVANGWYAGHIGNGRIQYWGKIPALLAQLEITFADGSVQRIVSDGSWQAHASPVLSSDFMLGERYDARQELPGWDLPIDHTADGWQPVVLRDESQRQLCAQVMEPVRNTRQMPARTVHEPLPGRFVFDLGQNMVGVVRLKVQGPAGATVTLRHGEMLHPDGTLYTANLRGAPSVDTYVCSGKGVEVWQPRFTFHGFRYVELSGLAAPPALDAVTGIVIGSDNPQVGQFACSDPRVNQLQSNIQWGQRGNYLSVPTDCPQRDERLGWMADAQVFTRTATYNSDVAAFFTKWLVDVDDAQFEDGRYTDVSPRTDDRAGTPGWADAGVICPWTIYQAYGDRRVLERHLPAMMRWIDWCQQHSTHLIRDKDRGDDFGDWLSIGAATPKGLIGTAYFAYSCRLVAQSAAAVGNPRQAAHYQQLFEDIRRAFIQQFVAPDGYVAANTQCAYVLALKFDLLPPALRPPATAFLVNDIQARDWHLSTGFLGVSYLLPVLTDAGQISTAYALLLQDTFPSWLFSVRYGATTIWERWDGWTPEKGFQDPGMNSFNHYSLGSCGQWLFESVAGISGDPAHPGFKHIIIHPRPGPGLTSAHACFESIRGLISTDWTVKADRFTLAVTIPANTSALVLLPTTDRRQVRIGGKPVNQADGVRVVKQGPAGAAAFEIGSGTYDFVARINR
jgi:alpha-L-rhamnosidase